MLCFSLLLRWSCTLGSRGSPHTCKHNKSWKPFGRSDATTVLEWENISASAPQTKLYVDGFPTSSNYSAGEAYRFVWVFFSGYSPKETMASEEFGIVQHAWHWPSNSLFNHFYRCCWWGTQNWAQIVFALSSSQAEIQWQISLLLSVITHRWKGWCNNFAQVILSQSFPPTLSAEIVPRPNCIHLPVPLLSILTVWCALGVVNSTEQQNISAQSSYFVV